MESELDMVIGLNNVESELQNKKCSTCIDNRLCNWIQEECDFPKFFHWRKKETKLMPSFNPNIINQFAPCPFCKEKINVSAETTGPYDDDGKSDYYWVKLNCKNCSVEFLNTNDPEHGVFHEDIDSLLNWWNFISGPGYPCSICKHGFQSEDTGAQCCCLPEKRHIDKLKITECDNYENK